MSQNVLQCYAKENIWAAPRQDTQFIIEPIKLTKRNGAISYTDVVKDLYQLPTRRERYHVYQIGQLNPTFLGLFPYSRKWARTLEVCNLQNMHISVYNDKGFKIPTYDVWYGFNEDRNLFICVKDQREIGIDLNTEKIYFRVYTSLYFRKFNYLLNGEVVHHEGLEIQYPSDIIKFVNSYNTWAAKKGYTWCYLNGKRKHGLKSQDLKVGDQVEFIHDGLVESVLLYDVAKLRTFESTLDLKRKYLLRFPANKPWPEQRLLHHDDNEVFLFKRVAGKDTGVYVHRNEKDTLRQLTHRDWSLTVPYTLGLIQDSGLGNDGQWLVEMVIRRPTKNTPLITVASRIHELYKLPNNIITESMVGINSVVPFWKAAALEHDAYVNLMRQWTCVMPLEEVQDALGYNSAAKFLGDTPSPVKDVNGYRTVDLRANQVPWCTGFEYAGGLLINSSTQVASTKYIVKDPKAELVEVYSAYGNVMFEEFYNDKINVVPAGCDFRIYRAKLRDNLNNPAVWEDITGTSLYLFDPVTRKINHGIDLNEYEVFVRTDKYLVNISFNFYMTNGYIEFTLHHYRKEANDIVAKRTLEVPPGSLDLFLNGHSLVEGLDYIVKFPKVIITNKEYLKDPAKNTQVITMRMAGFCNADFSRDPVKDKGFVIDSKLSNNSRYDLSDDLVQRVVVDGRLRLRSEIKTDENSTSMWISKAREGSPYMVTDLIVPMRGQVIKDTLSYRAEALERDTIVGDYMTQFLNNDEPEVKEIKRRHRLYSPFLGSIIDDLGSGVLWDDKLLDDYDSEFVDLLLKPYLYLLEYDPIRNDVLPEENYVRVEPHAWFSFLTLDIHRVEFLRRCIELYCEKPINFGEWVRLKV